MPEKFFIMTAHHKKDEYIDISKKYFNPIQVGKALTDTDLGIVTDVTGDNISAKNRSYCELTAYYWAWKNCDADYIGLMHYRRIFTVKPFLKQRISNMVSFLSRVVRYGLKGNGAELCLSRRIKAKQSDAEELSAGLKAFIMGADFDIVLPKKQYYHHLNMEENYCMTHNKEDFDIMKDAVVRMFPEMADAMEKCVRSNSFYTYNMMIMKKELYQKYCEMLFSVLSEVESRIDINGRSDYQKRVFGFLSERMLCFFVQYLKDTQTIKIIELDAVFLK
ncbi:MAG: DUF4422 domain-containing protein [Deferribacterales bacterium]